MSIPVLDLSWAQDPTKKPDLLRQLRSALFDVGFLYVCNHGVPYPVISNLVGYLPRLFALDTNQKAALGKIHNPHFLGYSGFAEETTLGKQDLREQFDYATELPVVYQETSSTLGNEGRQARDFSHLFWRLRGPNPWPDEEVLPGFRKALLQYHDSVEQLSYRFVHLIEEAFGIPIGTFDHFFDAPNRQPDGSGQVSLSPQHRLKLLRYPPATTADAANNQGVGAHKDSSGWLTFLYQVGNEPGLEVLSAEDKWLAATPIANTFVVNFGNALEAATEGAVKATTHRVLAPGPDANVRYSIPFFQGLPLDMTVSEVRTYIPASVRTLRKRQETEDQVSSFLDPRWDSLGESQLRKWIRSHKNVALKWYGRKVVDYYTA